MEEPAAARRLDSFAHVPDLRRAHARPRLCDSVVRALCAVSSGAEGWEDMAEYGQAQAEWGTPCLALPQGMPSHDTCRRVLSRLTPDARTPGFGRGTAALRESRDGESGARAGKTLRRSCARAASPGALPRGRAGAKAKRLG